MGQRPRGRPRATRPPVPGGGRSVPDGQGEPGGRRALQWLNPRKMPTRSRVRNAAVVFAALALVLAVLGLAVDRAYLQPALLTAFLALLWGVRAATMR